MLAWAEITNKWGNLYFGGYHGKQTCNTLQYGAKMWQCLLMYYLFPIYGQIKPFYTHANYTAKTHTLLCFIQLVGGWQEITKDHSKTPKLLDPKCHKCSFPTLLSPGSAQTCCSQWRRPWTGLTWLSLDPGETLSTHCPAAHNWWGNLFEGLMLESCGQSIMLKWACNIIDLVDARKCAECKSNVLQLKRKRLSFVSQSVYPSYGLFWLAMETRLTPDANL